MYWGLGWWVKYRAKRSGRKGEEGLLGAEVRAASLGVLTSTVGAGVHVLAATATKTPTLVIEEETGLLRLPSGVRRRVSTSPTGGGQWFGLVLSEASGLASYRRPTLRACGIEVGCTPAHKAGKRGLLRVRRRKAVGGETRSPQLRVHRLEVPVVVGGQLQAEFGVIPQPGPSLERSAFECDKMLV